jgi:hypothetical protein
MIQDRGKMKWHGAFFMPEHVKMLKYLKNDYEKQKKPQLDEDELHEIGFIVMESLHYTLPIQITIWEDGFFEEYIGIVYKVDYHNRKIKLEVDSKDLDLDIRKITSVKRV